MKTVDASNLLENTIFVHPFIAEVMHESMLQACSYNIPFHF